MASKSKEDHPTHKRTVAGGIAQTLFSALGTRRSSASRLSSGGESSRSTSDEECDGETVRKDVGKVVQQAVVQCQADSMEFCATLGRPDRVTTIRQIDGTSLEDFVVRASKTANHVLMMGSPCMMFYPLRCPFNQERCASFRAHAPQYMKEHLEAKHELINVQVNFACPCPTVCNAVNGQQLRCDDVQFDPIGGALMGHMMEKHPTYYKRMGHYLCIGNDTEEQLRDVPEVVRNYGQYLKLVKKLPAWTREDPQGSTLLFPSQRLPDKVILQTVIKDQNLQYICNITPCRGDYVMIRSVMCKHIHEPQHFERTGTQSLIFERCPKKECEFTIHWSEKQMLLHVRAMHPEMLDEPSNFTEAAKAELAKLVGQIQGDIIGQAIGDTAQPGDDTDGTKAHFLYSFCCHMQNCKGIFSEREHLEWHIMADHQPEWNKSGTSD